jgi:hypothetical protein
LTWLISCKVELAPVSASEDGQTHPLPDMGDKERLPQEPIRLDAVAN